MRYALLALLMTALTALAEENALERSLQKSGKAIDRGAKSAGRALDRTGNNVARGAEKVHDKIDEKVRPKKK
jgi:hypothetical protein